MNKELERVNELEKGGVASMNDTTSGERTRQKINEMLEKINDEALLNRIYRFIKYIYIHRT